MFKKGGQSFFKKIYEGQLFLKQNCTGPIACVSGTEMLVYRPDWVPNRIKVPSRANYFKKSEKGREKRKKAKGGKKNKWGGGVREERGL